MANSEHLAKLREGPEAWNRWRKEHAEVVPDLKEARLRHLELAEVNLRRANLGGANLRWANLVEANLVEATLLAADLSVANLIEADLSGANLIEANFSEAKLVAAKLNGSNLGYAILVGANLRGSDFHETILAETVFGDTDLTEVKGLETCKHRGPSIIDHRTLAKSGPLPLAFLRGCGFPDVLIDYLPSFLNQPIQFYFCFISYSTKDQEFAERVHADLQNKGVRCWLAPEDLKIGDPFRRRIDEAIRLDEKLVVILSEHFVRSDWVREEVECCFEREHREKSLVLLPLRLDDAVMDTAAAWAASIRRHRHIGDFSKWKDHDSYQKAFDRLLNDLKAETGHDAAKVGGQR